MLTEWLTCAFVSFTVETGFQANEIILREGTSRRMCLNTVGSLFSDTVINVTLIEGSAGAEGEAYCITCL